MVLFLFSIGVGLLYMFYRSLNSDQKKVIDDLFQTESNDHSYENSYSDSDDGSDSGDYGHWDDGHWDGGGDGSDGGDGGDGGD